MDKAIDFVKKVAAFAVMLGAALILVRAVAAALDRVSPEAAGAVRNVYGQ